MPGITRHFLGWEKPIVTKAVELLCSDWHEGLLDLQNKLIIVPTRNAARRLREALAEAAAQRNSAVLPGPVFPPEFLIRPEPAIAHTIASTVESLTVLTQLLLDIKIDNYPALFPYNSTQFAQNPTWAFSTAQDLHTLRSDLAENGLSIRQAAHVLENANMQFEPERWEDLSRLEENYLAAIKSIQKQDPNDARVKASQNPQLPEEVQRIAIIGVADPVPIALHALDKLAEKIPVDIYVHAPASAADKFDRWGRPQPKDWQQKTITIPSPSRHLLLARGPEQQASLVLDLLNDDSLPANNVAVGTPDTEVLPFVEHELDEAGWTTFNPGGMPLDKHPLARLAAILVRFINDPEYANFARLVRHPYFLQYFGDGAADFQPAKALEQLDIIQNRHLPKSFNDVASFAAREHPGSELKRICETVETYLTRHKENTSISDRILEIFDELFGTLLLDPANPEHDLFLQVAEKTGAMLDEINSETVRATDLPDAAISALITERLRNLRYYPERADSAIDLQGWLELAWEDSPHLIVTGMNEGKVPASINADLFLPDSARHSLGLTDNQRRFARDAYLLQTMLSSRQDTGTLHFITGKYSSQGDPMKPSRLLFLCPDSELAKRALQLFGDQYPLASTGREREFSWQLNIPAAPLPERLSVTQFRDYLTCPFRFYLTHVLKMEEKDDTKTELDALDFGTLCHQALEVLGDPQLSGVTASGPIETKLLTRLDELIINQFGRQWPAPLYFQLEALRQRLRAAARLQAQLHVEGWRITETEIDIGGKKEPYEINGMPVRGRIDRIDRHDNGMLRILDYKTAESATPPDKVLWSNAGEQTPEYARLTVAGKERAWADLQLPLYTLFAARQFPDAEIECGYFHLPKAVTDTSVSTWVADSEKLRSAERCASGVINDIRQRKFWPPAPQVKFDDYERLFFGVPEEYVNELFFKKLNTNKSDSS